MLVPVIVTGRPKTPPLISSIYTRNFDQPPIHVDMHAGDTKVNGFFFQTVHHLEGNKHINNHYMIKEVVIDAGSGHSGSSKHGH